MNVNEIQRVILVDKMLSYFQGDLTGKKIGIWGLSFKPNTDDIREAPALYIIESLLEHGATVKVYDPEAIENAKRKFGDRITYAQDPYEALIEADALAIITEWSVFRNPSFQVMKELMKENVIFDGRNLYDLQRMQDHGFYYSSIGRSTITNDKLIENH